MHWLDAAIILAFIAYTVFAGFRSRKQASKNLEEYFLAGRKLKGWQAGISMAATQFAADTPLLVVGLIATAGIFSLWQLWIYALSFLLMGFLFAPQWRRAQVLTDAEFTEIRYGEKPAAVLRFTKAIYFGTIFNCTVLAWVLFASAKIAEPFLSWDAWLSPQIFEPVVHMVEWVGVPISNLPPDHPNVWLKTASNLISLVAIVFVTTLYSTTGGLRSVVMTDIAQFLLMMLGTFCFSYFVVEKAGGLGAINAKIFTLFPQDTGNIHASQILAFTPSRAKDASFSILALFALQWIIQLNSDGTGYLAQRAMACKSDNDSKVAGLVFTIVQVFIRSLLWIPLGLGLLVLFPIDLSLSPELQIAARESAYVRGIAELLPIGIKGLMVTAMLAALASTLDTHLNWGSSYWTNDIYSRFLCKSWLKKEPSPKSLVLVARVSNLFILLIAFFIMTRLKSIQGAWQTSLLLGAGMGPVLLLRWLWWRINAWSEIAAIVSSAIFAPLLLLYVNDSAIRLLVIAVFSTFSALVAAYIAGPEHNALLEKFYARVHPAGLWKPYSGSGGKDNVRVLMRALGAAFTSALCLFCFLVGIGSWLAGSPEPTWFPWPAAWIPSMLILGLALVPAWLKLGFGKSSG